MHTHHLPAGFTGQQNTEVQSTSLALQSFVHCNRVTLNTCIDATQPQSDKAAGMGWRQSINLPKHLDIPQKLKQGQIPAADFLDSTWLQAFAFIRKQLWIKSQSPMTVLHPGLFQLTSDVPGAATPKPRANLQLQKSSLNSYPKRATTSKYSYLMEELGMTSAGITSLGGRVWRSGTGEHPQNPAQPCRGLGLRKQPTWPCSSYNSLAGQSCREHSMSAFLLETKLSNERQLCDIIIESSVWKSFKPAYPEVCKPPSLPLY